MTQLEGLMEFGGSWVDFRSPPRRQRGGSQGGRRFAMLGFSHYWGRSRKGRPTTYTSSRSAKWARNAKMSSMRGMSWNSVTAIG